MRTHTPLAGIARSTAAATLAAAIVATGATSALGFGSINYFGQNGEHEAVTRAIGRDDPRWEANSLSLLAGNPGNLGGVGAPDNPFDSGNGVFKGSGPGYKHCDNGDYLNVAGYPNPASTARANFEECARYYQTLLTRGVRSAGKLVSEDLVVNTSVFDITRGVTSSNFAPDKACNYPFSLRPTSNPKCDVMNTLGRALHMAEDVYAHSNWADLADPTKPISINNPPGLGNTTAPDFLRYPATTIVIPEGLISGCDDTASGAGDCKNRVTHSDLAKDNGKVKADGTTDPTNKYARGLVKVDGVTNFQRAVTMAQSQAVATWRDFEAAILAKYGDERGGLIIASIVSDQAPRAGVVLTEGEPSSDPSASAAESESAITEPESMVSEEREAAAGGAETNIPPGSGTDGADALWWVLLTAGIIAAVAALLLIRRSKEHRA